MSLIKRGNSKFWYAQFQINNRTIIRSTRTTDRKAAEKVAARIRADAHEEILVGRKKETTLASALLTYVSSKEGTPNHGNLISHRRTILRSLNGSTLLSDLTSADLEEFRRKRLNEGCAAQTIKHGISCIIAAVQLARKNGYHCSDIEAPPIKVPNKMVRYLTADDERRLLSELDPYRETPGLPPLGKRSQELRQALQDNLDIVVILLDTGARYSEIADLVWRQIDLEGRLIRLWRSKVQNESIIFMTDRVAEIVSRRAETRSSEFLFSNRSGEARGYSVASIRKAMRRAGIPDFTVHTLRHTHATRLIQNGMNVYEVGAVLGHSDVRTTMRYAHLEQAAVTSKARDVINRLNDQDRRHD
ncbi:site-specific integrase [Aquibium sp. ELW1220]|uniref:tyrosine-type recombinase/integrase n=1 Tax=Aquibium sp. ELW1220 TaxID=2976766 RepID=UPI0025B17A21|nr:site-specific integrase [Aquibium sp. ELW1220]MDN2581871.1 site-specific integrase [Aquibium sp. ELW1220]